MSTVGVVRMLALVAVVVAAAGCFAVVPIGSRSSSLETETRTVDDFDRISLSGSGEVIVTQDGDQTVKVEAESDLLRYVRTDVRGRTLHLGLHDVPRTRLFRPSQKVRYYVSAGDISGLEVSGSGEIHAEVLETRRLDVHISGSGRVILADLNADDLDVGVDGSGYVRAAGRVNRQSVNIAGSGNHLAADLESGSAQVVVGGSGNATVWVTDDLDVRIAGSGQVEYYGDPEVSSRAFGSGKIIDHGER